MKSFQRPPLMSAIATIKTPCQQVLTGCTKIAMSAKSHPWMSLAILITAIALTPICKYCSYVILAIAMCIGIMDESK